MEGELRSEGGGGGVGDVGQKVPILPIVVCLLQWHWGQRSQLNPRIDAESSGRLGSAPNRSTDTSPLHHPTAL